MDVYQENILEHARHPRNRERMPNATASGRASNPSCGDTLELFLRLGENGCVERCTFEGIGCALSQASASLLTQVVIGKAPEELLAMGEQNVVGWLGIHPGSLRKGCAVLPLLALQRGLRVWNKDLL